MKKAHVSKDKKDRPQKQLSSSPFTLWIVKKKQLRFIEQANNVTVIISPFAVPLPLDVSRISKNKRRELLVSGRDDC